MLKVMGFFIAGILVAVALLINVDTYSFFSKTFSTDIKVTAASTEDIIQDVIVDTNAQGDITIKVIGNEEWTDSKPYIYLEFSGPAAKYIPHINPFILGENPPEGNGWTRVDDTKTYELGIKPRVSLLDYSLLSDTGVTISADVTVRGFNNFIEKEPMEVTFTEKYLRDKFLSELSGISRDVIEEIDDYVKRNQREQSIVGFAAQLLSLDNWTLIPDAMAMTSERVILGANGFQSLDDRISISEREMPVAKVFFNDDQVKILDIITPRLLDYIDDLYNVIRNQLRQLADLEIEVAQQETIITEQESRIAELEKAIEDIIFEKKELERVKNEEINELQSKIEDLKRKIDNLNSSNADYRSTINILNQQIEGLQSTIDQLRTEAIDSETNDGTSAGEGIEDQPIEDEVDSEGDQGNL